MQTFFLRNTAVGEPHHAIVDAEIAIVVRDHDPRLALAFQVRKNFRVENAPERGLSERRPPATSFTSAKNGLHRLV